MVRASKQTQLCIAGLLFFCSVLSAFSYAQSSFSVRLDALKPQVKQDIMLNIERYWLIKTSQKMQASGFSQQDIETVIYGPAFAQFIENILNNPNTQAAVDHYIDRTLNEKNLLQHIQTIKARADQKQLEEYKEMLRAMAQLRKEQDPKPAKKPWYKQFFDRFELF